MRLGCEGRCVVDIYEKWMGGGSFSWLFPHGVLRTEEFLEKGVLFGRIFLDFGMVNFGLLGLGLLCVSVR